tara:strand:+ start:2206 stop:2991 length:786 start_codon:yes stop_codon:yes gene_type:complete
MESFSAIEIIYGNIITFSLVFTRIASLFGTISIFRKEMASMRLILSLTMILSVYAMLLAKLPVIHAESLTAKYFILQVTQVMIGFTTGVLLNILFEIFSVAGQIISMQIGLTTASIFDPKFGMITSLTHFYLIVGMVIFFSMDGHFVVIDVIVKSFKSIPVDTFITNFHGDMVMLFASIIFLGGVMISITIIASIMMTNICLAILSKFAPQFNLFSVGLNMSLIMGLICLYLTFNVTTNIGTEYVIQVLHNFKSFFRLLAV